MDSDTPDDLEDPAVTSTRSTTVVASEPASPRGRSATLMRPIDGERYAEVAELGSGGMGVVALVHDRQIRRDVARKRLRGAEASDPVARRRFAFEARLQGQLEHPAVVPLYDLGEAPDGTPYFTMKRVNGASLWQVLRHQALGDQAVTARWSRRKLLSALSQVCMAVHYAHERGVVHRDIKPDNIMLGDYGEVYLLDWGIAKFGQGSDASVEVSSAETVGPAAETQHGKVLGTAAYMAPEQARGEPPDARVDVFALGAILFEVLAGMPLRRGVTIAELTRETQDGVDVRPSQRAPEAEVPPELDELVARALAQDPAKRIASALELDQAIEAFLDGDRDLELRRVASLGHAEVARAAAVRALAEDGDHDIRSHALHQVGKALALDPTNQPALDTLVQLLTTPPRVEPPEVAEAHLRERRRQIRLGAIAGGLLYLYVSINLYTTWVLGIRDWSMVLVAHGLWAGALLSSALTIWRPNYIGLIAMFLFGTGASVYVTGIYSPFLMVPGLLAVHATLYSLASRWEIRLFVVVVACLGWTLAVFGERYGLFPDTVRFTGGEIHISSPAIALPEVGTTLYHYVAGLGLLTLPAVVVSVLRSSYERVARQTRLQSWQLQQLVHGNRRGDPASGPNR